MKFTLSGRSIFIVYKCQAFRPSTSLPPSDIGPGWRYLAVALLICLKFFEVVKCLIYEKDALFTLCLKSFFVSVSSQFRSQVLQFLC